MMNPHARSLALAVLLALGACGPGQEAGDPTSPSPAAPSTAASGPSQEPSVPTASGEPTAMPVSPGEQAPAFPTAVFARLGDQPAADALAAKLQQVLDTSANGDGLTATVISPAGTWSGATGFAAGHRAMRPDDQMSIASITKTLVAAQVMQLVEAGKLSIDDPVADRLPPGLEFDTNGATIADLLSHRSGYPDTLLGPGQWRSFTTDPLHAWSIEEVLGTVGPERAPVGQKFEYRGVNYVLLGLIIEHVTGRPLADVLRGGVLDGDRYERLIYQPDERPTAPMAMPSGAPADTFDKIGGYLPSLAATTAFNAEGAMASDTLSLARWFRALCAGEVVSAGSLDEMTDFVKRPEYGLGIMDRRAEYGSDSGALGHTGALFGFTSAALCFQDPGIVVVVLSNADEHDVDTTAGKLVHAAAT
jgi:D-alanyl-D-alanine carboxypeptidase